MILLVDAWNVFKTGYKAYQKVSNAGRPIGGVLHLLNTISLVADQVNANSIDLIWETDSSPERKKIFELYKKTEHPSKRANRPYGEEESSAHENLIWQIEWATRLLGMMGCGLISLPHTEADDIIKHLAISVYKKSKISILTSNSDIYPILENNEERISIYSQKGIKLSMDSFSEKFGIHISNFPIGKALVGEPSENIEGVWGIGWKKAKTIDTLHKKDSSIEDLFRWANYRSIELSGKVPKWIGSLNSSITRNKIKRNVQLISLINLNKKSDLLLRQQLMTERDKEINPSKLIQEIKLEGALDTSVWNSISCQGRRLSDDNRVKLL